MKNSSDPALRIAYFVDTFPQRTENFILRQIAAVREFWPALRVYCRRAAPDNWPYVDCREALADLPHEPIHAGVVRDLSVHLGEMIRRPRQYLGLLIYAVRLHHGRLLPAARRFYQAILLARFLFEDRIEHLHAHFITEPSTVTHLAARYCGIPYSVSAHAYDIWCGKAISQVVEQASVCVVCNKEGYDQLRTTFPKARVELIQHWLYPEAHESTQQETPRPDPHALRLISAGRYVPKKGFNILINACAILKEGDVSFTCEIVGEGPLKSALANQIRQAGLDAQVRLLSFEPHDVFRKRLARSDLLVLPCRIDPTQGDRDGIPNVLLEAIAEGCIPVAADLPSVAGVVQEGQTGFVFRAEEALGCTEAILRAHARAREWRSMTTSSRAVLAAHFSASRNSRIFVKALDDSRTIGLSSRHKL